MNLESASSKKNLPKPQTDEVGLEDFEFRPITSGLGFHQTKTTEVKPSFSEKTMSVPSAPSIVSNGSSQFTKKESNVYQNDLSLFYNQQSAPLQTPVVEEREEKVFRLAFKHQRVMAYVIDLVLVLAFLGFVLTVMAKTISMDLMEVWTSYPNEITPLVVILFCGFYVIYFSVFEKTSQSTIGKSFLGIKVVSQDNELLSFSSLLLRTFISLINFASLGLFSYFDLQNKITSSKVIRNK